MTKCPEGMHLDPEDPFDRLIIPIVEMNRRKRKDYASDDDVFKNFREVSNASMGMVSPKEYADIQVMMKTARIQNLRWREPSNEAVLDSYLDRAVYAVLAYGLAQEEARS